MQTLSYLHERGLQASRIRNRVYVVPRERITDDDRKYIKLHRLALLAELASGDGIERRMHWQILIDGKPISVICGGAMTRDEALQNARARWPNAEVEP